ncbi:hypothetical protein Lal_00036664 [Lupinus albus]|nr:hypothetical protein Lal_00036664 [Lupinus albus]
MTGRGRGTSQNVPNDLMAQMVAALQHVNENLQNLNQNAAPSPSLQPLVPPGPVEYRGLDIFYRRNPSQFQGGFAPDAGIEWVQGLQRIFRAMSCSDAQKVPYAGFLLLLPLAYSVLPLPPWKARGLVLNSFGNVSHS